MLSPMPNLNICLVAGEASGDVQGALLAEALPGCQLWGVGGPELRKGGFNALVTTEEMAVMGFAEIVSSYPRISKAYKLLLHALDTRKPDILVLVDYPGFNLRLAADAFARGITVVYHIAPKVWAHGSHRAQILAENTHLATCILPFEESLLRSKGVNAHFVGNPLRDAVANFVQKNPHHTKLSDAHFHIGLLPGSRRSEIHYVLPVLIQSFAKLQDELAHKTTHRIAGVLPVASTLDRQWVVEQAVKAAVECGKNREWLQKNIVFLNGQSHLAMQNVNYAWVCSGTASLETAFFGTPLSVIYKMSPVSYAIAKKIVKVPYAGLANLCVNRELVPEFLQEKASVSNLVAHALEFLVESPARAHLCSELLALRDLFPQKSAHRAGQLMLELHARYSHEAGASVGQGERVEKGEKSAPYARRFHMQEATRLNLIASHAGRSTEVLP